MMSQRHTLRAENRALQERQRALKAERTLGDQAVKILLIRHGETEWNATHRLQGQKDPPLNALGLSQAEAVAARLADSEWDAIYSSDLQRAAQTAQAILRCKQERHLDSSAQSVGLRPSLREGSIGILEGLTPIEGARQEPAAWADLCNGKSVPGGESREQIEARASDELAAIAQHHPSQTVIVVTHGGVLQVLYRHATGKEYSGRFKNCSINCLWMDGKAWKVGLWGDITHLSGIGVQAEAFGGGNTG